MLRKASLLSVMLLLTVLAGCSAIHSAEESFADMEQGTDETRAYNITAQQADAVIRAAFTEGWPDKELMPLEAGKIGYQIKLWFVIDREHVIAEAVSKDDGYFSG